MPARVQDKSTAMATGTSIAATFDGAIVQGNRLIAVALSAGHMGQVNTPGGWTRDAQVERAASADTSIVVFSKVAGASEPTTVTVTTTASLLNGLYIVEVSSCGVADQVDTYTSGSTARTSVPAGQLLTGTTLDANEYCICAVKTGGNDGGTITWTDSFTGRVDFNQGGVSDKVISATGTVTATPSWSSSVIPVGLIVTYRDGSPAIERVAGGVGMFAVSLPTAGEVAHGSVG